MEIDLDKIRSKNQIEYGTGNTHLDLLRSIYPERTHFVFELIQNASDAEATEVDFRLFAESLHFTHNGRPFNARDVEAICRIAEGTKKSDVSKVGKFGIGFKAVYNYTSRPEIYSREFSFCIQDYVRPYELQPRSIEPGRTLFIFPFNRGDFPAERAVREISEALIALDRRILIFLNSIRSISWRLPNSRSGELEKSVLSSRIIEVPRAGATPAQSRPRDSFVAMKNGEPPVDSLTANAVSPVVQVRTKSNVDQGTSMLVPTEIAGASPVSPCTAVYSLISLSSAGRYAEQWHLFSTDVDPLDVKSTARVDLAFLQNSGNLSKPEIQVVDQSFLHVCFATHKTVPVGYIINGPFYTTPARDNLDNNNQERNKEIIKVSTALLKVALLQFKQDKLITGSTLSTLALSQRNFPKNDIFRTVFDDTRQLLLEEEILPTLSGNHAAARLVLIPANTEIRNLFGKEEIAALFRQGTGADWLAPSIADKPELSQYLEVELGIRKITVDEVANVLDEQYLTSQPDDWLVRFYSFCQKQPAAIIKKLRSVPVVRLEDGTHVTPLSEHGKLNAYLPMRGVTGLPFVRAALVKVPEARAFLQQLGVTEPDDVHDTLTKVIPQLQSNGDALLEEDLYAQTLRQIMFAFQQADRNQAALLESRLKPVCFLRGRHAGDKSPKLFRVRELYSPSDRLVNFFRTASGVWFPDLPVEAQGLLPFLDSIGLMQFPEFVRTDKHALTELELKAIEPDDRLRGKPADYELKGLEEFMQRILQEPIEQKLNGARMLWRLLADMIDAQDPPRAEVPREFRARITIDKAKPKWLKLLQSEPWLPDSRNKFFRAADLSASELPPEFVRNKKLANLLEMKDVVLGMLARETGIAASILDFVRLNPDKIADLMLKSGSEVEIESGGSAVEAGSSTKAANTRGKGVKVAETFLRTPVSGGVAKKSANARNYLFEQYGGKCQICGAAGFPTTRGDVFFEAIYLISTRKGEELDIAGNMVSVCALCSARLLNGKVATPENILLLLKNIDTSDDDTYSLNILMGDERRQILFSPAHKEQVKHFVKSEAWKNRKAK